jgi:polar amino acid transport system substrate-binding protein
MTTNNARAQATKAPINSNSTLDRVRQKKILRVAALNGEAPYFIKNLITGKWTGACIDMAQDIASKFGASVELIESTWGNQILDLQTDKVDLAFCVNPTPERALVIDFTAPLFSQPFVAITRKGFAKPHTWSDLNSANVRIAVDLGSSYEMIARRYLPKANISSFKNRDEAILAVSTNRADVNIASLLMGLPILKKSPGLAALSVPVPTLTLPACMGIRFQGDYRWRDFLSVWSEYNRSLGQTREWIVKGLAESGIAANEIPPEIHF